MQAEGLREDRRIVGLENRRSRRRRMRILIHRSGVSSRPQHECADDFEHAQLPRVPDIGKAERFGASRIFKQCQRVSHGLEVRWFQELNAGNGVAYSWRGPRWDGGGESNGRTLSVLYRLPT